MHSNNVLFLFRRFVFATIWFWVKKWFCLKDRIFWRRIPSLSLLANIHMLLLLEFSSGNGHIFTISNVFNTSDFSLILVIIIKYFSKYSLMLISLILTLFHNFTTIFGYQIQDSNVNMELMVYLSYLSFDNWNCYFEYKNMLFKLNLSTTMHFGMLIQQDLFSNQYFLCGFFCYKKACVTITTIIL